MTCSRRLPQREPPARPCSRCTCVRALASGSLQYLGAYHPKLVRPYAELYRNGSYVTRSYAADLARRSSVLLRKHGLDRKDSVLRISDTRTAAVPPHLALSEPSLF